MHTVQLGPSHSVLGPKIQPLPLYASALPAYRQYIPLDGQTVDQQEQLILQDLVYVLDGHEGNYIRYAGAYDPTLKSDRLVGPEFVVARALDPSLKAKVRAITQTARHYCALTAFVDVHSTWDCGRVSQALCASLRRRVLAPYAVVVAQLERRVHHNFTLNAAAVLLHDSASLLLYAYGLAQAVLYESEAKSRSAADRYTDFDRVLESMRQATTSSDYLNRIHMSMPTVCKGGALLRLVAAKLDSLGGDPGARSLLEALLQDTSRPYLAMLQRWLGRGVIDDPCQEFMVRELQTRPGADLAATDYTDEYWEKRYAVRTTELPLQLADKDVYDKVLLTGKYLNVIRECGGSDQESDLDLMALASIEDSRLILALETCYTRANSALLQLLIHTHGLSRRLHSLKRFFLLDRADFLTTFFDTARAELLKPSQEASTTKLQYLLDMALRHPGSISDDTEFKDDLVVDMNHTSVFDFLIRIVNVTGMDLNEARATWESAALSTSLDKNKDTDKDKRPLLAVLGFQLDFTVPFPISLVLSRKTILRYQLLFRHLVELKFVETALGRSWLAQAKETAWRRRSADPRVATWVARAVRLRSRMLIYVQQTLYYVTMEVIEPNWARLQASLDSAQTADVLMERHLFYLDNCMKEAMLTNEKLLRLQAKLHQACRAFGGFLEERGQTLVQIDPTLNSDPPAPVQRAVDKSGREMGPDELVAWLQTMLEQYEAAFDHHLRALTGALNYFAATETTSLLTLCAGLELCQPV